MSEIRIAVGTAHTSALFDPAQGEARATFIAAHGAGGNKSDRGMQQIAATLTQHGFDVLRFNFLYREKGRGGPDPMPKLKQCVEAAANHARSNATKLIIGGRSMGGRAASMLAADGFQCDGLLLLAYPLHPPGKPTELRTAHLTNIKVPVLCLNGTRDTFCTQALMEQAQKPAKWQTHWLDAADHSFKVPKSSGRTEPQVYEEIGTAAARWLDQL